MIVHVDNTLFSNRTISVHICLKYDCRVITLFFFRLPSPFHGGVATASNTNIPTPVARPSAPGTVEESES